MCKKFDISHDQAMDLAIQMMRASDIAFDPGNPVPMVGAIAIKDGIVIAKGSRSENPTTHAERALIQASKLSNSDLSGATVFVTLMPCISCATELASEGISEVVVGIHDPNWKVTSQSYEIFNAENVQISTCIPDQKSEIRSCISAFLRKFCVVPHEIEHGVVLQSNGMSKTVCVQSDEEFTIKFGGGSSGNAKAENNSWTFFYGPDHKTAKYPFDGATLEQIQDVEDLFPSSIHYKKLHRGSIGVLEGKTGYLLVKPTKIKHSSDELTQVNFKFRFLEIPGMTV